MTARAPAAGAPKPRRGLRPEPYGALVVGAGFAGAILAERLASQRDERVLVVDRREHVGGNAHDFVDDAGVLCHRYGPHIFHTNSERVVEYLSRFTDWRPYEHRVLASVDGRFVPVPINRTTLSTVYGVELADDAAAEAFLAARREPRSSMRTSEDVGLAGVGSDLFDRFFRGYTRKQWARDPSELDAAVCARIPVRTNLDDRYFTDAFQQMPADGYTRMFERILDHPRITVATGTAFAEVAASARYRRLVWTGPIDEFFEFRYGRLPYRSLRFEFSTRETPDGGLVQPVAQLNFPDERVPFTRTTEFRHLTGQAHDRSTVAYEYPAAEGEPYYPVPCPESRATSKRYAALAEASRDVAFAGRLARYQYLNMDQVVAQALATFDRLQLGAAA